MTNKTKQQNKIPKLRFPGFSEKWKEKRLGEIATFLKGKGISKNDIVENGKNKCIRYGELYTEYNEIIDEIKSRTNFSKDNAVLSEKNDILMPTSDVTPNGLATASALNEVGVILGGDILIIRSGKILNKFFSYYVVGNKKEIMRLVSGVTVYHIYGSDLATLKIKIPSLSEQEKIAGFLGGVDEWIENLKKQKEELEKYKKGIMQKIFSQEIRFKPARTTKLGGDNNGKNFPKWEEKRLKEAGEIITGTTPSTQNKEYYNGKFPWITPTDINENKNIYTSAKLLSNKGLKKGRFIPKDSLLVTCIASIGKNAILRVDGSCNQQINAIVPNKENDIDFLYYLLEYKKQVLIRFAGAGGMHILNKNDFSDLKFIFPSLPEQQKIASFLSAIDKKIELVEAQIQKMQEWKRGLMRGLLV